MKAKLEKERQYNSKGIQTVIVCWYAKNSIYLADIYTLRSMSSLSENEPLNLVTQKSHFHYAIATNSDLTI